MRRIKLPGSKSVAARALVLNFINGNVTRLQGLPDCDDTRELASALKKMRQMPGREGEEEVYWLGSGAASMRFFVALAASTPGFSGVVDCSAQLRGRPLSPLVDALRSAGAEIEYLEREGCAPLRIKGRELSSEGVDVDMTASSQFASALIMASQLWKSPFVLKGLNAMVSQPYIEMTQKMVGIFKKKPDSFVIEPDWSAASYFYEWALLNPGDKLLLENLVSWPGSLQGDAWCKGVFAEAGVVSEPTARGIVIWSDREKTEHLRWRKKPVWFYMIGEPDLVPALACGLCRAGVPFEIGGVGHLRHKESDRIAVLVSELGKLGYDVESAGDKLAWNGRVNEKWNGEVVGNFDAHGDHRIAMALAAMGIPEDGIEGSGSVSKSFPGFFAELAKCGK